MIYKVDTRIVKTYI